MRFICIPTPATTFHSWDKNVKTIHQTHFPERKVWSGDETMLFYSVPDFIGFACHEVGKNELTTSPVAVMIIIASKVASGDSTLC